MIADRPACRTGDDKVVLATECGGGKLSARHLERPFDTVPERCRGKLVPQPLGESAEMILDMIFRQRLAAGSEGDLTGEREAGKIDELFVFDEHAVQRDTPTRRQASGS